MSKSVIAGAAISAALVLVGCAPGTGGTGTDSDQTSEVAAPTTSAAPAVNPCETLKAEDVEKAGLRGPGTPKRLAGSEACDFKIADGGNFSVLVNTKLSVDEANVADGKVDTVSIEGTQVKRVRELVGTGDCGVLFPLAAKSYLQISATVPGSTDEACQVTQETAPLVLANVPKN